MALTRITKGVIKPNENYDTHNINSTGIVTAVGANFTGSVSVGGTLTYEDVTSIDSVGIITAQNGIDCNGDLDVDGHTNLDNVSIAGVSTFTGSIFQTAVGSNTAKITLNNASDTVGMDVGYSESSGLGFINVGQSGSGLSIKTSGTSGGNERFRITNTGKILIGSNTIRNIGGASASGHLQVEGTTANTSSVALINNQANTNSPVLSFGKTRGTSAGAVTTVTDGDNLGSIKFCGADGTDIENSTANIKATVNGTVAGNQIPTDLVFETSPTNSSSRTERFRITSNGKVGIGTTNPTEILDVLGNLVVAESIAVNRPRIVLSAPNDGTNYRHLFGANLKVDSSGTFTTPTANISGGGWEYLPANSLNAHGDIRYLSAPDTNATTSTPIERLRITSAGKVGIGTHNPNAKLEIEGTAALTNQNQTFFIRDSVSDDATGRGGNIGFGAYVDGTMRTLAAIGAVKKNSGTGFDGHLALYTRRNGVGPVDEVMRLESGGNVGIGTASPDSLLSLFSDANDEELIHFDMGSDADRRGWKFKQGETGTSTQLVLQSDANGKAFNIKNSIGDEQFYLYTASSGSYLRLAGELHISDTIQHTNDTDTKIRFPSNDNISFETAGTERLKIHSVPGNVSNHISIGSSAASNTTNYYLAIKGYERSSQGASGDTVNIGIFNQSGATAATASIDFRLGQAAVSNTAAVRLIAGKGGGWTNTTSTRDGYFAINVANNAQVEERFRITNSGRVGINTNVPLSGTHISDGTAYGSPQNASRKATLTISAGSEASADIQLLSANYNHIFFGDSADPNTGMIHYEHTGSNVDSLVFSTAGSQRLRINSAGRIIVGHTEALSEFHGPQHTYPNRNPYFQLHGSSVNDAGAALISWKNSAGSYYAPALFLAHSGSDTIGTNGILPANGEFGSIIFSGDDGTDFVKGAMIKARLDGTPGNDDMPGRLEFYTTPDGAQVPEERLRITSSGDVDVVGGGNIIINDNKKLYFEGDNNDDFNCIGRQNSENSIVLTSRFNLANIIDSNNDDTDSFWSVRHNGTTVASSGELIRVQSDGKVGIASAIPQSKLDVFVTSGTIAQFGDPRNASFECIRIKNDVASYPAVCNDSSHDTLDLRSMGSVQATIDSNGNSTGKYFRVMTNDTGDSGTELFRVGDDGKVGIANDNPTYRLEVGSTVSGDNVIRLGKRVSSSNTNLPLIGHHSNGTGSGLGLCATSSSGHIHFFTGNNPAGFGAGSNTERLRITSDGQIGVNNTTDAWHSSYKSIQIYDAAVLYGSTDDSFVGLGANHFLNTSGDFKYSNTDFASRFYQVNGEFYFESAASGTAGNTFSFSEKFRITSDGEVSIGGISPSAGDLDTGASFGKPKLHVQGNNSQSGAFELLGRFQSGTDADNSGATIVLNHSNDRGLAIQGGRNGGNRSHGALMSVDNIGRLSDCIKFVGGNGVGVNNLRFYTGETATTDERVRINDTGQVLINQTTATYSSVKLEINGNTTSGDTNYIVNLSGDSDNLSIRNHSGGDYEIVNSQQGNEVGIYDGTGGARLEYANNGNYIGIQSDYVTSNRVYSRTTTGDSEMRVGSQGYIRRLSSTRRFKNNIREYVGVGVSAIKQIVPKLWEDHEEGFTKLGFIAEEIHDIGLTNAVLYGPYMGGSEIGIGVTYGDSYGNGSTPVTKTGEALDDEVLVVDGLDTMGIIAELVVAVKQLTARIETLESGG